MPYITKDARIEIDHGVYPKTPGELNYKITKLLLQYLDDKHEKESYTNYNEVIGVLECLKLEMYRRRIAPYEDYKRDENGEVFNH